MRDIKVGKIAGLVILVAGLGVGLILVEQRQNIFSRAWSGLTSNPKTFQTATDQAAKIPPEELPGQNKSQALFQTLVDTYPKAEKQDINLPDLQIAGTAYFHYDPLIDKSYVFSSLHNLPAIRGRIVRLWLIDANQGFTPAGIADFVAENNQPTAYSVFVKSGNLKNAFKQLVFSYDISSQDPAPLSPFLGLNF